MQKQAIYRRGKFWLDFDRGKNGKPTSPNLCIWWYDPETRHERRKSTRTADYEDARTCLDAHYLKHSRGDKAPAGARLIEDVVADYWLEHGCGQASASSINARLNHILDFLPGAAKTLGRTITVAAIDDEFVTAFLAWSAARPVVWKNKAGEVTRSQPRKASTSNESLLQLRAALKHDHKRRRLAEVPFIPVQRRGQVSELLLDRVSIDQIAAMLDYAAASKRRGGLQSYLVAAITTLARPGALVDINTAPERSQWDHDGRRLNLNPRGRAQTRKYRPIVPVGDLLNLWLTHADPWLVNYYGRPVASVRNSWNTMLADLALPGYWEPKLLRHSMATELRRGDSADPSSRCDPWELQGQLGHKKLDVTEVYAIYDPDYLGSVQAGIDRVVRRLEKHVPEALHPKCTRTDKTVVPMPIPKTRTH